MGATTPAGSDDFSDTPLLETISFTLHSNVYWNGAEPIPSDTGELVNISDDAMAMTGDPVLADSTVVLLPRWFPGTGFFGGGYAAIEDAFTGLGNEYGRLGSGSAALSRGYRPEMSPVDLLGNPRGLGINPDAGAVESIVVVPALSIWSVLMCLVVVMCVLRRVRLFAK